MSERFWQPSEPHPPRSVLFLYVEGELDDRETALVRQHLADCWDCRARCEDLEKGIHDFVSVRRDVLIPRLPPPPPTRQNFFARLKAEDEKPRQPSSFDRFAILVRNTLSMPPRSAWLTAAVTLAMAAGLALFYLATPRTTMTPARFFERVRKGRNAGTVPAQYVAVQKVRFRQVSRTIERQVIHGRSRATSAEPNTAPSPVDSGSADSVLKRSLTMAHIDLDDPLNADAFERWHDSLTGVADQVGRTTEEVTLVTKPSRRESILLASLTVRADDWHPISERFEFSDEPPLEVREISWELRREALPAMEARLPPPSPVATAPTATPEPSEADLERSEVAVREAMHRLGADRNEVPEIVREDHRIDIRAVTDSDERREQLLTSIAGIPYVYPEVGSPGSPVSNRSGTAPAAPRPVSPSASHSTTPPLAKELWDYKSSMDVANSYLDTVRDSYFYTLADATLLTRLAQRYPEKDWNELPADVQTRVTRLASDYVQAIQKDAPEYVRRLSDPLDEMVRRTGLASASLSGDATARCEQWQSLAPRLIADLQETQTSFRRLFVVDQTATPLTLTADGLLSRVVRLRSSLNEELRALCLR